MSIYDSLPGKLEERIKTDLSRGAMCKYACRDEDALRKNKGHDASTLLRPAYVRDCAKILNSAFYNRYTDKTQVFSFYRNDDISRRALHVQLVSRIARDIGRLLRLNCDLIEAIALGHDIGHTPFGHEGERLLSALLFDCSGKYFNHNVQSARLMHSVFPYNISLQTLDGMLCHNGEFEQKEYRPSALYGFDRLDAVIEECMADKNRVGALVPCTLEGCVVRVSDIIAYIGKDRQDAEKLKEVSESAFSKGELGAHNASIINNMMVNIVKNSYAQPFIKLDDAYYAELRKYKEENYSFIYRNEKLRALYDGVIAPMFSKVFKRVLDDLKNNNAASPVFRHHIALVNRVRGRYHCAESYENEPRELIAADYLASMTDDYFLDCFAFMYPDSRLKIDFKSYFDER